MVEAVVLGLGKFDGICVGGRFEHGDSLGGVHRSVLLLADLQLRVVSIPCYLLRISPPRVQLGLCARFVLHFHSRLWVVWIFIQRGACFGRYLLCLDEVLLLGVFLCAFGCLRNALYDDLTGLGLGFLLLFLFATQ